jgi:hypothetical protein
MEADEFIADHGLPSLLYPQSGNELYTPEALEVHREKDKPHMGDNSLFLSAISSIKSGGYI